MVAAQRGNVAANGRVARQCRDGEVGVPVKKTADEPPSHLVSQYTGMAALDDSEMENRPDPAEDRPTRRSPSSPWAPSRPAPGHGRLRDPDGRGGLDAGRGPALY